jgi:signal peptidase I
VDLTGASAPYNYCNTLLLHWVRVAFSGARGSIRYKLVPRGIANRGDVLYVQRSTYKPGDPEYYMNNMPIVAHNARSARVSVVQNNQAIASKSAPSLGNPFVGYNGMALTTNSVNGVLEFEVPYYSRYRFTPGKNDSLTSVMAFEGAYDIRMFLSGDETGNIGSVYDIYVAAGEDYQNYFFTGMPRMYYEAAPPA